MANHMQPISQPPQSSSRASPGLLLHWLGEKRLLLPSPFVHRGYQGNLFKKKKANQKGEEAHSVTRTKQRAVFAGGLIINNKVSAAWKNSTEGMHCKVEPDKWMIITFCPEIDVSGVPPFGRKRGGWGFLLARAPTHSTPLFPLGKTPRSSIRNNCLESRHLSNISSSCAIKYLCKIFVSALALAVWIWGQCAWGLHLCSVSPACPKHSRPSSSEAPAPRRVLVLQHTMCPGQGQGQVQVSHLVPPSSGLHPGTSS